MEIGTPLPADLETINSKAVLGQFGERELPQALARLHAVHAQYDAEIAELVKKKITIKDSLVKVYARRNQDTMAGFDNVVKVGPAKFSLDRAAAYLADAAMGLINLPSTMAERLKKIVDSGKDEE